MIKFFIVSVLLHALAFSFFFFRQEVIIEDPIFSVEIDSSIKATSTSPSVVKKKSMKPKKSSEHTISASSSNSSEIKNSEESLPLEDSLGSSSAVDSQMVTVKPRVLHQEKVEYPPEAETARIEGAVKLSVVVNTQGQVVDVKILEGPGYGLNEAAANALKKFRFSAAEKEGEKVSVRLTYIYRFRLDSR
ncbi:MAG: energy transducer TonB [Bdellovibrionales bacterium]